MKMPVLLLLCFVLNRPACSQDISPLIGRWDITFDMIDITQPGWLEIYRSGHTTLVGRIVVIDGSARPISEVIVDEKKFNFTIPVQWEHGKPLNFSGRFERDTLKGSMVYANGITYTWTAVRAPKLNNPTSPEWGEPILLFDGSSLDGWTTKWPNDKNQWVAEQGILRSPSPGANLRTVDTFGDFKLFIEFRYPENGNSGIYLRGRYELQIEDSKEEQPGNESIGSIYGFIAPSDIHTLGPGKWQSYEITLVGRMVSVKLNGSEVICNQEIPGITGGAIDSREGEPGPILLQGDHRPIEYRNIVLIPAK